MTSVQSLDPALPEARSSPGPPSYFGTRLLSLVTGSLTLSSIFLHLMSDWSAGCFSFLCECMLNRFTRVRPFSTPQTVAHRAPLSMGFSRQDTGVGCHALLQGIFPTQGSNPYLFCLRPQQEGSSPLGPPGKPSPQLSSLC